MSFRRSIFWLLRFAVAREQKGDAEYSRLISLAFYPQRAGGRDRRQRSPRRPSIAYLSRRASAQLEVKPAQRVPIWFEPSQICNRRLAPPQGRE
jgi:hypothetical protein